MADDTPKPGLKKAPALPRPEITRPERAEPIRPDRRLTPLGTYAVNPSEYTDDYEADSREARTPVYSDLPVDAPPTDADAPHGPALESIKAANPPHLIGLTDEQIQRIADQLKTIAVSTIKASIPPPPGRPSMPVQVAKGTKNGLVISTVVVTLLGMLVEYAARQWLNTDGPWTEFIVTFGRILQRIGN